MRGATLINANMSNASAYKTDFSGANMKRVSTTYSNLTEAILRDADLQEAHLEHCRFNNSSFENADLRFAAFTGSDLSNANLENAFLYETVFADVVLVGTSGLSNCRHNGPSVIDHRTFLKSVLPRSFLEGVGLPNAVIEYMSSQLKSEISYYSCFISYSSKEDKFARLLHQDLQKVGVRCWFAPHDLPIGGKTLDEIHDAIQVRDKVLLILSEHSISSNWVEDEVMKGYEEEQKRATTVLFPIRLDDAVMGTGEAWAAKLRQQRHIGDFCRWKTKDDYELSLV
jgi:uncharacterized protein YjbI with pentapeptide repeats